LISAKSSNKIVLLKTYSPSH